MLGLEHLMVREGMGPGVVTEFLRRTLDTWTENFSVFSYYGNEQRRCVQLEMHRERLWMQKQNA